jgi:AcrR family transcriptional regulator
MTEEIVTGRLTRERVLLAALCYVDAHGMAALSMQRLGAELGVKGMSLYSHVASKGALLDGIVEAMWAEVAIPDTAGMEWQDAIYSYGQSLRVVIGRHPEAASLLSRPVMPVRALEEADAYRQVLLQAGFTREQSVRALRIVFAYARGYALTEASWRTAEAARSLSEDDLSVLRRISGMVPDGTPDDLLRFAIEFCVDRDPDAQFESGLDLIVGGLNPRKWLSATTVSRPPGDSPSGGHRPVRPD